jgi:excinuclease ABC subunit C
MPDLVVIDGGIGQVDAARRAFADAKTPCPPLIGLAKREETVVGIDGSELKLPRHHEGLRLLQRLRDEAHRFANNFNAELRGQRLRESLLDEVEGLGASRKAALLAHFGSIQALRRASAEAIAETPGVGPQLAARIVARLAR